jgi:hypothetical protein
MQMRISALILIIIWSFLLVPNVPASTLAKIKAASIHGEGFGNNGLHFMSFVDCTNQQHKFFYGGSHTNFIVDLSNTTNGKKEIGTWMIEYKNGALSDSNLLFQRGFLINGTVNGSQYNLTGLESIDTVCKESPTRVTITGQCGNNTTVNYKFANGEKMGSTVPPNGDKVYYVFGSNVHCTIDNNKPLL